MEILHCNNSAYRGQLDVVQFFVTKEVDINATDNKELIALDIAR